MRLTSSAVTIAIGLWVLPILVAYYFPVVRPSNETVLESMGELDQPYYGLCILTFVLASLHLPLIIIFSLSNGSHLVGRLIAFTVLIAPFCFFLVAAGVSVGWGGAQNLRITPAGWFLCVWIVCNYIIPFYRVSFTS